MKPRLINLFWGILLILVAAGILAQQQGWIDINIASTNTWMWIFAGAAFIFLVMYLVAGLRQWGWLFPACILGAIALVMYMTDSGIREPLLGTPIFVGIALPFLVAFFLDTRRNWWALIPAFACGVLATVLAFELPGELVGALVMYSIALPFLLVWLVNRTRRWALIPAGILALMGTLPLLSLLGVWVGPVILLLAAAVFFYVFFKDKSRWWAVIPAGLLASMGVQGILTLPVLGEFANSNLPAALMFLGWTATFGWLWLQRARYDTEWARIPAIVFAIVTAVQLVLSAFNDVGLIALLLVGGAALIYLAVRPGKKAG